MSTKSSEVRAQFLELMDAFEEAGETVFAADGAVPSGPFAVRTDETQSCPATTGKGRKLPAVKQTSVTQH